MKIQFTAKRICKLAWINLPCPDLCMVELVCQGGPVSPWQPVADPPWYYRHSVESKTPNKTW